MMVIDIAHLEVTTTNLWFVTVDRAIHNLKLDGDRNDIPDKIILFVDELNK